MQLLEVSGLKVHYPGTDAPVRAVDGISFSLQQGETKFATEEGPSPIRVWVRTYLPRKRAL